MVSNATITEVSVTDLPYSNMSGTSPQKRSLVAIRYTSAAGTDVICLGSVIPGMKDIEGQVWNTMNNAVASTANTWASDQYGTTTITTAADGAAGAGELGVIITYW